MTIFAFTSAAADQLKSPTTYPTKAEQLQSAKLQQEHSSQQVDLCEHHIILLCSTKELQSLQLRL